VELEITCCSYEEIQSNNYFRNFEIIKCVGSGGFSKVYMVRGFGKLMAMKVINKEYILSNDKANIVNNEKTILSICSDHPFITKLEVSF
jgi:serine/threonine protein kinase